MAVVTVLCTPDDGCGRHPKTCSDTAVKQNIDCILLHLVGHLLLQEKHLKTVKWIPDSFAKSVFWNSKSSNAGTPSCKNEYAKNNSCWFPSFLLEASVPQQCPQQSQRSQRRNHIKSLPWWSSLYTRLATYCEWNTISQHFFRVLKQFHFNDDTHTCQRALTNDDGIVVLRRPLYEGCSVQLEKAINKYQIRLWRSQITGNRKNRSFQKTYNI